MQFEFKIEEKKDHVIIALAGNLVQQNQAIDLLDEYKALIAQNYNQFNINLEQMQQTNNEGLQVFLKLITKARIAGGDAFFYGANPEIRALLEKEGLITVIDANTVEN